MKIDIMDFVESDLVIPIEPATHITGAQYPADARPVMSERNRRRLLKKGVKR